MTTNIVQHSSNDGFNVIKWKHFPVCTVKQAAEFYGVDETNIKTNFNRNKSKFIEGKHFFTLKGKELKEFKRLDTNCIAVDKATAALNLFTQKGMARIAKSCGSDRAWEVFEKLEDTYFKVQSLKEMAEDPNVLIDLLIQNRAELQRKVEHLEVTKAQISSKREAQTLAKYSHVKHHELIDQEQKQLEIDCQGYFNPTEIGEMVEEISGKSCSSEKANKILIQLGFQNKDTFYMNKKYCRKNLKNYFSHRLTPSGKSFAKVTKHYHAGKKGYFTCSYKWKPEIAQFIAGFIVRKDEVA
jgi:hypothetical protein